LESNVAVYVSFDGDTLVATAALEHHGRHGLLRSVCVHPEYRGQGKGRAMAVHVLQEARTRGLKRVFLLTETAAEFFSSMGFLTVDRRGVPEGVRTSIEFATLCPASAIAMAHAWS
jgi:N-acetylglutamate synthase-like GNAT family acetyltransferase